MTRPEHKMQLIKIIATIPNLLNEYYPGYSFKIVDEILWYNAQNKTNITLEEIQKGLILL